MNNHEKANVVKVNLEKDFEAFFKEHYSRLYYYALHYIQDQEICKDIVSESFYFMWKNKHTLKIETALTYMYTHVGHQCIDYLRKKKMIERNALSYISYLKEQNSTERAESEERIRKIMEIINQMPPITQRVIELCYIEKKKYREVAQILNLSENGVRKQVMKGLDTIRKYFSVNYKKGEGPKVQ